MVGPAHSLVQGLGMRLRARYIGCGNSGAELLTSFRMMMHCGCTISLSFFLEVKNVVQSENEATFVLLY